MGVTTMGTTVLAAISLVLMIPRAKGGGVVGCGGQVESSFISHQLNTSFNHRKKMLLSSSSSSSSFQIQPHAIFCPSSVFVVPSYEKKKVPRKKNFKQLMSSKATSSNELEQQQQQSSNDKEKKTKRIQSSSSSSSSSRNKKMIEQNPNSSPLSTIVKFIVSILSTARTNVLLAYGILSRRTKMALSIMALLLTVFLFGSNHSRQLPVSFGGLRGRGTHPTTELINRKPMELPYSVFMDLVEQNDNKVQNNNKAGQIPPPVKLETVVIGRDRISFRVNPNQQQHTKNIISKNKKLSNDLPLSKSSFYVMKVNAEPHLIDFLHQNKVPFRAASTKRTSLVATLARSGLLLVYLLFMLRMYRAMSGGGGGGGDSPGQLASNKRNKKRMNRWATTSTTTTGKTSSSDNNGISFDDIEGIDGAKLEVMELVDMLRDPNKYAMFGARAPTGLLLEGPPGTGKTMLARATASAARVPLIYCSGSDFVEMFVGRGAARVRKLFQRASKMAPCIIFIDELDALGKSRGGIGNPTGFPGGGGGGLRNNDEAEQTLNQLLACMDGLSSTRGVCVLAATNRRDVLDPALVRPGRFDRIVRVELPNAAGRERILRVHANRLTNFREGSGIDNNDQQKPNNSLGKGAMVDLSAVAAATPGLSGAELEFIVNEAAIRAVRRVSAAIREGRDGDGGDGGIVDPMKFSPQVQAVDFEMSVANFFQTRRSNSNSMGDLLSNVWGK